MYAATSHENIEVRVEPSFLAERSEPARTSRYFWAYEIEIANRKGVVSVQLLSRHWIITDGSRPS